MIEYLTVFLTAILLAWIADRYRKTKVIVFSCLSLLILVLALFAGVRDIGVGTDTLVYSEEYFNAAKDITSWDDLLTFESDTFRNKSYLVLNNWASYWSSHVWIALFFTELAILIPLYLSVYNYSQTTSVKYVVFTTIYLFIFYNFSFNIMRQSCAVSFVFWAFCFYIERKWILFLINIFIAYHFHSTSILYLLIPLLYTLFKNKLISTRVLLLVATVIGIAVFFFYYEVLEFAFRIGFATDYFMDNYGETGSYVGEGSTRIRYVNVVLFLCFSFNVVLSYKKRLLPQNLNSLWAVCTILYISFSLLALYVVYIQRINYAFYLMCVYFSAVLLSSRKVNFWYKMVFYFVIVYSWYYNNIINNFGETYPYKSAILGI